MHAEGKLAIAQGPCPCLCSDEAKAGDELLKRAAVALEREVKKAEIGISGMAALVNGLGLFQKNLRSRSRVLPRAPAPPFF